MQDENDTIDALWAQQQEDELMLTQDWLAYEEFMNSNEPREA